MKLITILLVTVSILTFLSGIIVLFGSSKKNRARSIWYFLAALMATVWMVSISFFLIAGAEKYETIDWHIIWTFISAVLLDIAFLGFSAWQLKYGKALTIFFFIFGLVVSACIAIFPHEFYTDVQLSTSSVNGMTVIIGPLFLAYCGFFSLIVPAIIFSYLKQYFKSRPAKKRGGDLATSLCYGISSLVILVCNLILPLLDIWGMIWLGPLSLAMTIISVYYTTLRYRLLDLSSVWLKIFSRIVLIASVAIIYMIIFSLVFAGLFRGSTPSLEVIILNFVMIIIFLSMMPAISSVMNSVRAIINEDKTKKDTK